MQDAADDLVAQMMRKYNTEKAIVFNTLQMYRWDRLDYLKNLHQQAKTDGFFIGMKIVRGAYMEKERNRAEKMGYESPVQVNKLATDTAYNAALSYSVNNIEELAICAGSHNEESCMLLANYMHKAGLPYNHKHIYFSQLLGMSDHISFNLAHAGYNVAKYVPYGPVRDVLPYLLRRAEENTSVAGQTPRELSLIMKERKRRKK
jgi:proline dehydrogenase